MRLRILLACLALMLAVVPAVAQAQSRPPHAMVGELYIDEEPAPVGTRVEVLIDGAVFTAVATSQAGRYSLAVPEPPGNNVMELGVNGVPTGVVRIWQSGQAEAVNLDVSSVLPTPVPQPTAMPQPTPTPQPTATPFPLPDPTIAPTRAPLPGIEPSPTPQRILPGQDPLGSINPMSDSEMMMLSLFWESMGEGLTRGLTDAGLQGPQGEPGPAGADGKAGEQGEPGEAGPAGAPGMQGQKGDAGRPGEAGEPGPAGETGPAGASGGGGMVGWIAALVAMAALGAGGYAAYSTIKLRKEFTEDVVVEE